MVLVMAPELVFRTSVLIDGGQHWWTFDGPATAQTAQGRPSGDHLAGVCCAIDYSAARISPLPEPWYVVRGIEQRGALVAELQAELSAVHRLYGQPVTAVAACEGCDDVIFCVEIDPAHWVRVHLTWRRSAELPPWPEFGKVTSPLSRSLAGHEH